MIHTEQHDSVEGSAGKNGGIPVQHGVEGLFQLQRTTTKGCQLILVPVYFNIGGIFQKMYNVHILHMLALCKAAGISQIRPSLMSTSIPSSSSSSSPSSAAAGVLWCSSALADSMPGRLAQPKTNSGTFLESVGTFIKPTGCQKVGYFSTIIFSTSLRSQGVCHSYK